MQKLLTFFQQKNIRILYIESAKTVNEMTLNELVKLHCFEQLGPDLKLRIKNKTNTYVHPSYLKLCIKCTKENKPIIQQLHGKQYTFRGGNCKNMFYLPSEKGVYFKKKSAPLGSKFFPLRVDPF